MPAGMDLIFFSMEEGIERLKAQEQLINEMVKELGLDKKRPGCIPRLFR